MAATEGGSSALERETAPLQRSLCVGGHALRKTGAAPLAAHVTSHSLFCEVLKKTLNPSDRGLPPHKLEC